MYGSDQSASLEPSGLRQLLGGIRKLEVALGDGVKRIVPEEELIMQKITTFSLIQPFMKDVLYLLNSKSNNPGNHAC